MACSACNYAMAMRRAAKEVLLLAWTSAVVLVMTFVAARLFVSTEAARGIVDFLSAVPMAFNAAIPIIVFSRVLDVAAMQRYMRAFDKPCPICGGKHE